MRPIDADVLKAKLKEHHDFFIKAWEENGVDRLSIPIPDKSRIDEIDNCIAEIVNAPTVEFPFVHVKIKHPRFGECDGWLDKQRQLLFFDFITTEMASKYNWEWEEAEHD